LAEAYRSSVTALLPKIIQSPIGIAHLNIIVVFGFLRFRFNRGSTESQIQVGDFGCRDY